MIEKKDNELDKLEEKNIAVPTRVKNTLTENDEVNDMNYIWNQFGTKPNKVGIYSLFEGDVFWEILDSFELDDEDINIMGEIIVSSETGNATSYRYLIKIDDFFVGFYEYKTETDHTISNVIFYFKSTDIEKLNEYLANFSEALVEDRKDRTIDMLTLSNGMFGLSPITEKLEYISDDNIDLFELYSSSSRTNMSKMLRKIDNKSNEIYALSGIKGSNKTMFIKYLIDKTKKSVVIVPMNLESNFLGAYDLVDILRQYPDTLYVIDNATDSSVKYLPVIDQALKGIFKDIVKCNFIFCFDSATYYQEVGDICERIQINSISPDEMIVLKKKMSKEQLAMLDINNKKTGSFY